MDDETVMSYVRNEDNHAAFAQLMSRWEDRIVRLCGRIVRDPNRAEDLKQEAFARVYARRRNYNPAMRFSTWLWTIASNLCYDELRKHERQARLWTKLETGESIAAEDWYSDASPCRYAARSEEAELVRSALEELPEILRIPMLMRFRDDLRLTEIGGRLGIAESTVRYRLAEGLSQMTAMLGCQFRIPPLAQT